MNRRKTASEYPTMVNGKVQLFIILLSANDLRLKHSLWISDVAERTVCLCNQEIDASIGLQMK